MSFVFSGLDHKNFDHLYELNDAELEAKGVMVHVADGPGFPCRVTLEGARVGERVLLLNYQHLDVDSPYRASYAIYVRNGAQTRELPAGELPAYLENSQIALRAFDHKGLLLEYRLAAGPAVRENLHEMLYPTKASRQGDIAHIDIHFAGPGCYFGRVTRTA